MPRCGLLVALLAESCWGKGYLAREAFEAVEVVEDVPRLDRASARATRLVDEFLLRDRPVVVEAALSGDLLARTRAAGYWQAGRVPRWFVHDVLDTLFSTTTTTTSELRLSGEFVRGKQPTQSWGCARPAKQCAVAWWYSGTVPAAYRQAGAPARGGSGAFLHTDAVCAPSWSLQVEGRKRWTLLKRTRAEAAVPIGDEFFSREAYSTVLEPGDLLLFFNGWQPHATSPVDARHPVDAFTASVNGLVDFPDLPQRLWGPASVRAKVADVPSVATPSPRLFAFCPDLRDYFVGSGGEDAASSCGSPSSWKAPPRDAFAHVAETLGHLAVPAAADVDGDSHVDLVVGQADGSLLLFPSAAAPVDLTAALRRAAGGGSVLHAAPAFFDDGDDGQTCLAVGLYDGRVAFLSLDGNATTLRPPLRTDLLRAGPIVLGGDLLVGGEDGTIRRYRSDWSRSDVVETAFARRQQRTVLRFAAGRVAGKHVVLVADGGIPALYAATYDGASLVLLEENLDYPPLALSLDNLADAHAMDAGSYAAPALADFSGDGVPDLLLGDLFGNLLFFDGATPVPAEWAD